REPTVAIVSVGAPLAPAGPAAWAAVAKMSPAASEAMNETIRMAILLFAEKRGGYGGGGIGSSGAVHARVTAQGLLAERQVPHRTESAMPGTTGIVPFWKQYDRKAVLRFAQLAEDLGYESIWVPEAWAYEQFQLLAEIALATKRIKVATGIVNVFSRSPGLLAMSAATLDEIWEGRVILGLGTSGKIVVENFHGIPYEKPLTRLRETIGILRALWRGERLEPEMSTLFAPRHFKLEMTPRRADIPIYVASLQEKAIRDVGRVGDGWIPTFWPYRHLRDGIAWLAAGAEEAGRGGIHIEVAPFMAVVPLDDRDAA